LSARIAYPGQPDDLESRSRFRKRATTWAAGDFIVRPHQVPKAAGGGNIGVDSGQRRPHLEHRGRPITIASNTALWAFPPDWATSRRCQPIWFQSAASTSGAVPSAKAQKLNSNMIKPLLY
jgi:hypothetical protein